MKIRLYIAASLDGYIAGPNHEIDWLNAFHDIDYGYKEFMSQIDTLVMGRKSYDVATSHSKGKNPFKGSRTIVVSRTLKDAPEGIEVASDIDALISELRGRTGGKDVWMMGGGELTRSFLERNALDKLEIHTIPVILGAGIPLFPQGTPERRFKLTETKLFANGVMKTLYVPS